MISSLALVLLATGMTNEQGIRCSSDNPQNALSSEVSAELPAGSLRFIQGGGMPVEGKSTHTVITFNTHAELKNSASPLPIDQTKTTVRLFVSSMSSFCVFESTRKLEPRIFSGYDSVRTAGINVPGVFGNSQSIIIGSDMPATRLDVTGNEWEKLSYTWLTSSYGANIAWTLTEPLKSKLEELVSKLYP